MTTVTINVVDALVVPSAAAPGDATLSVVFFDHRQCGGEPRAINMAFEYIANETSFCIVFIALRPLDEKRRNKKNEPSMKQLKAKRFAQLYEKFKGNGTIHYVDPSLVCIARIALGNGDFVRSTLDPYILERANSTAVMEEPIEYILKMFQKCFNVRKAACRCHGFTLQSKYVAFCFVGLCGGSLMDQVEARRAIAHFCENCPIPLVIAHVASRDSSYQSFV